ncbi:hypothetical protein CTAYLR_007149 [Chrysophaeum taylorii]|uniref:Protein kinase domain-containing protein n=1 Tax=Chrysophaeum taylorii TaxID=2483200 RepID=A0AAD7XLY6_9STRA|nr:hypothetical protein CTAYLR_007149 [Chrysophaeum taylorii]
MMSLDEHLDGRVLRRIDVRARVGRGAYGIVWKGIERRRGHVVALKKCVNAFASSSDAQRTYREISYLRLLRHANVIQIKKVIRAKNDLDMYLVFEHMDTDLHALIRANLLEDVHKRYIGYQLFKALTYIHSAGVVHRDVKPSNMLLNENGHMKLCDFGLCRSASNRTSFASEYYVATRWYRAPEILLGSPLCLPGLDLWATGCIVGEMYHGQPVLPGDSTLDQLARICKLIGPPTNEDIEAMRARRVALPLKHPPQWTFDAQAAHPLVARMLCFNPAARITARQALKDEWVADFAESEPEPLFDQSAGPILLPIPDDRLLSANDYRDRLVLDLVKHSSSSNAATKVRRVLPDIQAPEDDDDDAPSTPNRPTD